MSTTTVSKLISGNLDIFVDGVGGGPFTPERMATIKLRYAAKLNRKYATDLEFQAWMDAFVAAHPAGTKPQVSTAGTLEDAYCDYADPATIAALWIEQAAEV